MIVCTDHDEDVEITGGRGLYFSGWCDKDGGHEVEVEAY